MYSLIPLTNLQSLQYGKLYPRYSKDTTTIRVYWATSEEKGREVYILATHLGKYNGKMSCEDVRYEVEERGRNQGGSGGIGIESEK